jgi:AraC family transcriptional regulator
MTAFALPQSNPTTPDEWARTLSGPPSVSSDGALWPTALLKHWVGTDPIMDQPPLDHHYVVQHLGGAKQVDRRRGGSSISTIVKEGTLTFVPAGTEFKWHTRGPIEFAHLYISPTLMARTALRFDRVNELSLVDTVGCRAPLLEAIYAAMRQEITSPRAASPIYLDTLLETFLIKLLLDHSTATLRDIRSRETLPSFQVRRILDFIEAHLDKALSLDDLVEVAGGSPFHFSRAFKNTVGDSPYKYLLRRRLAQAQRLLVGTDWPLLKIAQSCGYSTTISFARSFSRFFQVTPTQFRDGGRQTTIVKMR